MRHEVSNRRAQIFGIMEHEMKAAKVVGLCSENFVAAADEESSQVQMVGVEEVTGAWRCVHFHSLAQKTKAATRES
ncbi:MAG: hypothetical protein L0338_27890 [Acidobacteria bacterium]|nr:hypothetical protein [Acidobacteriota bacterium]